jgi:hypothetical protein
LTTRTTPNPDQFIIGNGFGFSLSVQPAVAGQRDTISAGRADKRFHGLSHRQIITHQWNDRMSRLFRQRLQWRTSSGRTGHEEVTLFAASPAKADSRIAFECLRKDLMLDRFEGPGIADSGVSVTLSRQDD